MLFNREIFQTALNVGCLFTASNQLPAFETASGRLKAKPRLG